MRFKKITQNNHSRYSLLASLLLLLASLFNIARSQTYCYPFYSNSCFNWGTTYVSIGSFTHSPACGTSDYTSQTISLVAGVSTAVSLDVQGWCSAGMAADFNNDGDFADTDETLALPNYVATNPATYSFNITVPVSTPTGTYRLRIWNRDANSGGNPNTDPCGTYAYGRFEDYTLNVTGVSGVCVFPVNISTTSLTNNSADIQFNTASNGNTSTSFFYELRTAGMVGSGATGLTDSGNTVDSTLSFTGLYQGTMYNLYLRTFCSVGDTSTWTSFSFTTVMDTIIPVPLANFNADVIANGIGTALSSTNNDVDGVDYCLVSLDYQTTSSSPFPIHGLPLNRTMTNQYKKYVINYYEENNSLRMPGGTNGVLTFLAPKQALKLYVMGVSGSGSSFVNATIYFDDGSTQLATLSYPDWYNSGSNVAIEVGRINNTNDNLENGPYLHDAVINIDAANITKQIDSVSFSNTGNVMNVLAMSVLANNAAACNVPSNFAIDSANCTGAYLTWMGNGSTSSYQISYGAQGFHSDTGTIVTVSGSAAANTYTFLNPSTAANMQLYLRSDCGGGLYSDWIGPIDVTFPNLPVPTFTLVDTICEGTSGIVLSTTSDNGFDGTWNPATVDSSTTTTYTFTPNTGQCAQIVSKTIYVNPLVYPSFSFSNTLCAGSVAPILPDTADNGIYGMWNPAAINNTTSGTYQFTPSVTNMVCTDIVSESITILQPSQGAVSVDLCQNLLPYTWNGQTYNSFGTNIDSVVLTSSSTGCDSIVYLSLIQIPDVTPTLSVASNPSSGPFTEGTTVTFTASFNNAGSNPSVQWMLNNQPLSGDTSTTFTAVSGIDFENGDSIGVVLSNLDECSVPATLQAYILLEVVTAIRIPDSRIGFKAYPNPSNSVIQIEGLHEGDQWMLSDLSGKVIAQNTANGNQLSIDLSKYAVGTYQMVFTTNKGEKWYCKVIKQ